MPFTLDISEDGRIVLIKNTGELTYESVRELSAEAMAFAEKSGARLFLSDCTEISNPLNVFDAYRVPALYNELNPRRGLNKLAILLHENVVVTDKVRFFETVCMNNGRLVKLTNNRDAALEWLLA